MRINAESIRQERQQRGWTQQHLADAANLSLRTIQRIENQGVGSNESVAALCAVFDMERHRILAATENQDRINAQQRRLIWLTTAAAVVGGLIGAGLTLWLTS